MTSASTWLRLNKLALNAGKTELIFFHSKHHLLNYDSISIKFNDQWGAYAAVQREKP